MQYCSLQNWILLPPPDILTTELKDIETIGQLHSFPMLVRLCSKSFKLSFRSTWSKNFQIYKLPLEKAESQRPNCQHLLDHRESKRIQKTPASLTMWKPLTVWITTNWKILKEMGIPDHLTCLLRNLYVDQEAAVRTEEVPTDQFKIGKGVWQGSILSPCLFNFYAVYIMQNARLDKSQAGIKITRRNIKNLRYADDTTLMAKSKEELKSILMKVKEDSEKLT